MTELYQIYYPGGHVSPEKQKEQILPFAIPYFNEKLTIFFENDPIKKLVLATKAEKIGVCSWKLSEKMRSNVGLAKRIQANVLDGDYDVLSLTKNGKKHTTLAHLYQWHPKSKETMTLLWNKLGYPLPGEVRNPIYQNHHISKIEIYRDYVNNFLSPAMELTENDEELNKAMTQRSGYGKMSRSADLKRVKEQLNMDDYPLSTFILERCLPAYLQVKNYRVTYL